MSHPPPSTKKKNKTRVVFLVFPPKILRQLGILIYHIYHYHTAPSYVISKLRFSSNAARFFSSWRSLGNPPWKTKEVEPLLGVPEWRNERSETLDINHYVINIMKAHCNRLLYIISLQKQFWKSSSIGNHNTWTGHETTCQWLLFSGQWALWSAIFHLPKPRWHRHCHDINR